MRILAVHTSTLPDRMGGSERVVWELARGLTARGHDVRILVPRPARALPPVSRADGLTIVRYYDPFLSFALLYGPSLALARRAIAGAVRAWRPDVVHTHQAIPGLAAAWAGCGPRCFTFYGPWHLEFLSEASQRAGAPRFKRWTRRLWMPAKAALIRGLEGGAVRRSDRVVVLSRYSAAQVADIHGAEGAGVVLIPGGVDVGRFVPAPDRDAVRKSLGLDGAGPLLFTVRRLVPRMGLEGLLEAMRLLPAARLVVGGTGTLRPRLEAAAARLGVADRVRFVGFIPDSTLPAYYQAADLVVLPSVALEGFGLITLEALACGTPVVSAPGCGAVDVLAPLAPSWLASDHRPASLASAVGGALDTLSADPATRERCRRHATTYAWERISAEYEALYRSLGGLSSPRP